VTKRAEASGSPAFARRPRDNARLHPRTPVGPRSFSAVSVLPRRSAPPAEIAQARVFQGLLQAECAELQELALRMAGAKAPRTEPDDSRQSEDLTQIRARIDEVRELLQALQDRFPHSLPEGDR